MNQDTMFCLVVILDTVAALAAFNAGHFAAGIVIAAIVGVAVTRWYDLW